MRREEQNLQIRCVKHLLYNYGHLVWQHSSNEGRRSVVEASYLKKMGMQAGWPDLDIFGEREVIDIEFKTSKGRQTPEQKRMQERLERIGHKYYICRSYEQFREICKNHFGEETDPDVEQLMRILNEK